jgi:hypothetical protein
MPASTRLPGIQFDVVAPPATPDLVRMDIAAFVGFAASGPLNIPVAVEDINHFSEIFGDDLSIGVDPATRDQAYGLMPSSVRAFFRNGGTRCWVIRVAGPQAAANRFPIPGLSILQDGNPAQAYARARSEGSWCDSITVGAALRSDTIEVLSFAAPSVRLLLSSTDDVQVGDVLRLTFGDAGDVFWLFVDQLAPASLSPLYAGAAASRVVDVSGSTFYWSFSSPPFAAGLPVCERLTMDLFVQDDSPPDYGTQQQPYLPLYSIIGLGFAPSHPRYWANLPTDAELYGTVNSDPLWTDAAYPRFPLAGEDRSGFYLPLQVEALPQTFSPPELSGAPDPLVRDGVSVFDASLFLDASLANSSTMDLLPKADYIRYQGSQPRNLTGIHAALAIDEATIIAAPDAVQRGWLQVVNQPLPPPGPSSPLQHPEWWHFLACPQPQPVPLAPAPSWNQFQPCDLLIVEPPVLQSPSVQSGSYTLQWNSTQTLASFTDFLEEAVDPDFVTAEVIYQGGSQHYTIFGRPAGNYYYRVRRQSGSITSDYSNGVGVRILGENDWQVNPTAIYQDDAMLAVHSALLRMCAARGDIFAILAMPEHYRDTDAIAHAAKLKSLLAGNEQPTYSFGALYHPWLIGREEDDLLTLRSNPPDGAMAGIMAMRSSTRGAWISPANEPLHGVVDMTPPIARTSRQALQDSLINLVRQEPAGFVCLCELTLTDDPDLSPINVRRLLSFLRKTVLRAGNNYVFEPNGDDFRRAVQRGFEILLDRLFVLGAFAGRTSSAGFQVITDSSVNTPQAMDQGQFIVEIRVAPSLPMRFLTVRLLQTADRTFVTEGGA